MLCTNPACGDVEQHEAAVGGSQQDLVEVGVGVAHRRGGEPVGHRELPRSRLAVGVHSKLVVAVFVLLILGPDR